MGIDVADVQDAIQTAVDGKALTQVPHYRVQPDSLAKIRLLSPTGERASLRRTAVRVFGGRRSTKRLARVIDRKSAFGTIRIP